MCLNLYNGTSKDHCGLTTSGGTESIILALLCYREWGKKTKGIKNPNFVVCETAHAAFWKAAYYL
jgi:sphinganine-1-phosphate aldolase